VADHYELIEFAALRREVIAPARQTGARRTSIDNPAQTWLDRLAHAPRLAVVGVELRELAARSPDSQAGGTRAG
jgi:hypothetical protein